MWYHRQRCAVCPSSRRVTAVPTGDCQHRVSASGQAAHARRTSSVLPTARWGPLNVRRQCDYAKGADKLHSDISEHLLVYFLLTGRFSLNQNRDHWQIFLKNPWNFCGGFFLSKSNPENFNMCLCQCFHWMIIEDYDTVSSYKPIMIKYSFGDVYYSS